MPPRLERPSRPYPYITIVKPSLQEAWKEINRRIAYQQFTTQQGFVVSRDFGAGLHGVTLVANRFDLVPAIADIWYPSVARRVKTLHRRYIHPEFWAMALRNMHVVRESRKPYAAAGVLQFHRTEKIPRGGPCLLDLTLMRVQRYGYEVHINSRAVESVKFLTGDMHFMWTILHALAEDMNWPELLENIIQVKWNFSVLQQSRDFILPFLAHFYGWERTREYLLHPWLARSWPDLVRRTFYQYFLGEQPPRFRYKQKAIERFFQITGMTRAETAADLNFHPTYPLVDWWDFNWDMAYKGSTDERYAAKIGREPTIKIGQGVVQHVE